MKLNFLKRYCKHFWIFEYDLPDSQIFTHEYEDPKTGERHSNPEEGLIVRKKLLATGGHYRCLKCGEETNYIGLEPINS